MADDSSVASSEQPVLPAGEAPASTSDSRWQAVSGAWRRIRQCGLWPRAVSLLGFVPVLLAGLLLGRSVLCYCARLSDAASTEGLLMATATHEQLLRGGIGGEAPDLLLAAVVPHTTIPRRYRIDPITYTVGSGDSVYGIAEQFGVSGETILWANGNLEDNPDYLVDGDVLIILPVSGVYHTVVKGDTLESIAKQYQAKVLDITSYEGNYLQEPYTLTEGQKLIVPGGSKPYKVRHVVAWSGTVPEGAKRGTGSFGFPISGFVSQPYSEYHRALDIAAPKGTPVKACDSGYVAVVGRSDTSYGRYVVIDHGNGYQTLYGHFDVIFVEVGQSVGKGQTIGLCGSTGKSTGPHVHLELILNGVKRNPALFLH